MSKSRKKKHKRGQRRSAQPANPLSVVQPYAGWIAAAVVIVVLVVAGIVILASGDGSGDNAAGQATQTPDPRVGDATPAASIAIAADDDGQEVNARFEPASVSGAAGQVIEIVLTNNGSVVHNIRVSGLDQRYDTLDDFFSVGVKAGETERLRLKIGQPGSYPFRCDFHPAQQVGTLVLQ